MPEKYGEVVFIDPEVIKKSLEPIGAPHVSFEPSLEPSAPHFDEPEVVEVEPLAGGVLEPEPGPPPIVGGSVGHYTNVLDQLWAEFDDPEERTAGRLLALVDEVADEAQRLNLLAMEFWERTPESKVPRSERERYQKEFLAYLRRLKGYKQRLLELPADSTDTQDVYIGLVKRKDGAGPVPDAIMHMYFANQIGILSDHAHTMGEGFVGRVMTGLDKVAAAAAEAGDAVTERADAAREEAKTVWDRIVELRWWILGGSIATVAASTGVALAVSRSRRREPSGE